MSHAHGEVIVQEGEQFRVVGFFEYNGTCDVVLNRIQPTRKLVSEHWRTPHNNDAKCTCGKPPTDVILWNDYADGWYWPGKACLTCGAIVDGLTPYGPEAGQYSGKDWEWEPTDGHPFKVYNQKEMIWEDPPTSLPT